MNLVRKIALLSFLLLTASLAALTTGCRRASETGAPEPTGEKVEGVIEVHTVSEYVEDEAGGGRVVQQTRWTLNASDHVYDLLFSPDLEVELSALAGEKPGTAVTLEGGRRVELRPWALYRAWGTIREQGQTLQDATRGSLPYDVLLVEFLEYVGPAPAAPNDVLLSAIYNNDPEQALEALRDGADLSGEKWLRPPLQMAATWGGPEVIQVLIENATADQAAWALPTMLEEAIVKRAPGDADDLAVISLLLDTAAPGGIPDATLQRAWEDAADWPGCRELLERHGARPHR
ncbi:MAG: hypothetical protein Q9Q40_13700 [Acidobacteriota bacterium]|nr:hypothetical protein [Acidobacteriota bacterium]